MCRNRWITDRALGCVILSVLAVLIGFTLPAQAQQSESTTLSVEDPAVRLVMKVQDRHTPDLLNIPGVNGAGTGLTEDGQLAIIIFTETDEFIDALPTHIEDIPVVYHVVGPVTPAIMTDEEAGAASSRQNFTKSGPGGGNTVMATRPAYIGTSTGNWNECGAGTIGVRVKRGSSYFAISCNHVLARTNGASIGERILQPGRADIGCAQNLSDTIGHLTAYPPLTYGSGYPNAMDAAMTTANPAFLSASTPPGGYGAPSATTVLPALSMSVKKYGKRTGLTSGTIAAVNVTISVNYAAGTAYFAGQIVIQSGTVFADGGDSGALLVTNNTTSNPVGMIFAKSGTTYTFATPINTILSYFDVQIDNGAAEPLPVELSSFSGALQGENVQLKWRTETELNNFGFSVQRSIDKEEWEELDFVAGAGDSFSPRNYSFTDVAVASRLGGRTLFYRLLQMDRDGTQEYSSVLQISQRPVPGKLQVFPHPVRSDATLNVSLTEAAIGTLNVYDAFGRRLEQYAQSLDLNAGTHHLSLAMASAPVGNYFVEFHTETGILRKHILVAR